MERTITFVVHDGDDSSPPISRDITDDVFNPTPRVPGPQVTDEDTNLIFSNAIGNAITVGGGDIPIQVELENGATGTFTLAQTTGITIVNGSNGGTAITIEGTGADIDAALDGLIFTPNPHYNGTPTITVTSSLSSGLIGFYKFEGNGEDSSNAAAPAGVLVDNASYANDGTRDNVLELDGTDDAFRIDYPVSAPFENPSSVTLSAWIRADGIGTNGSEVISINDDVILRLGHTAITAYYWNGTSWPGLSSVSANPADSEWHHVAFVIDDVGNNQALYVDGVQVASGNHTSPIVYKNPASPLMIGAHAFLNTYAFNGRIDDAQVYNRALN